MSMTYVVAGFAVGLLVGMTGVGGGSLMTPLLTLLFGVSPSVAVGTDLAFAAITKSAGTITHRFTRTVHWQIVGRLCLGRCRRRCWRRSRSTISARSANSSGR